MGSFSCLFVDNSPDQYSAAPPWDLFPSI